MINYFWFIKTYLYNYTSKHTKLEDVAPEEVFYIENEARVDIDITRIGKKQSL